MISYNLSFTNQLSIINLMVKKRNKRMAWAVPETSYLYLEYLS